MSFRAIACFGKITWPALILHLGVELGARMASPVAAAAADEVAFRVRMKELNQYMQLNQLPKDMRLGLREYFHQSRYVLR